MNWHDDLENTKVCLRITLHIYYYYRPQPVFAYGCYRSAHCVSFIRCVIKSPGLIGLTNYHKQLGEK